MNSGAPRLVVSNLAPAPQLVECASTPAALPVATSKTFVQAGHLRPPNLRIGHMMADFALIALGTLLLYAVKANAQGWSPLLPPAHTGLVLSYAAMLVAVCKHYQLYDISRSMTRIDIGRLAGKAIVLALLMYCGILYLAGLPARHGVIAAAGAIAGAVLLLTHIVSPVAERAKGAQRRVLIVGATGAGRRLENYLLRNGQGGRSIAGFLDDKVTGPQILGTLDNLEQVCSAEFIDEVILAIPTSHHKLFPLARQARLQGADVTLVMTADDGFSWGRGPREIDRIGDLTAIPLHRTHVPCSAIFAKRVVDVVLAAVGLLVLAPVFAMIAIAIRLDSSGPIFYGALRVGKKGHRFSFWKFRTMVPNADVLKAKLRAMNERQGPFFKIADDPRVTRVGRFLRRTSLDELPQLWNVLRGDMSLVGPRPHPLDDFERYELEHLRRLLVTPGITGLWQVTCRQDPSFEKSLGLDLDYIENWSLWLDFKILLKTLPTVLQMQAH